MARSVEEVVDAAAQFRELTSEEAYDLCARAVRGEPLRQVEIPKDSPLRPNLFHYRPKFPHPLPFDHPTESRYENERAMRRIHHLRAPQRVWLAVTDNRPWCVEELYMTGFPLNTPNPGGLTPLHLACHLGFAGCVQVLLDAGVDPTDCRTLGANVTPLESARAAGHTHIVAMLTDRGFDDDAFAAKKRRHEPEGRYRSIIDAAASLSLSSDDDDDDCGDHAAGDPSVRRRRRNNGAATTVVDDLAEALQRPPYYLQY